MKIRHFLQEILFLIIIVLSILDLFEILPGEINVFKRILSWVLIGYFCAGILDLTEVPEK